MYGGKEQLTRKSRYDYLKDFVADETGKYVFAGTTYTLNAEGKTRFQVVGKPALFSALAFSCAILSGVIPASYMNGHAAVVLLYAVALIWSAMATICAFRIAFSKLPMRDYTYKETVDKIVPNAWIATFGFILSALAYLYFVIRSGFGNPSWASILFLAAQIGGGFSEYRVAVLGGRYPFTAHPGKQKELEIKESELPDPDEYRVI